MRGSVRGVGLVGVVLAAVPATARAQSDDVDLNCENPFDGTSYMNGTTVELGQTSFTRCNLDFTNLSGAQRNNVYLRVIWEKASIAAIAPSLPDGVEGLANPFSQTWSPAAYVFNVPGNPVPIVDTPNQTVLFALGSVPDLFSSEVFFEWSTPQSFPAGVTDITVQAWTNGPPGTGSLVRSELFHLDWDADGNNVRLLPIPVADAAGRYVGSAALDFSGPTDAQTDVSLTVYLPYWNGTAFVADGNYNPLNPAHEPVVNSNDFGAELILRDSVASLTYEMPPGTPLDGNGNQSWPLVAPNANLLVVYDPSANTLTGRPGVIGVGESASNAYMRWKLRWDADFSSFVSLPTGTNVPVQMCWTSAETGPVAPGDLTRCETANTTIGAESASIDIDDIDCPEFLNFFVPASRLYPCSPQLKYRKKR